MAAKANAVSKGDRPAGVKGKLLPASKARPCPVCDGDHKCSSTADGLILCGRNDGPVPGFRHLGACADPTWHMYRAEESAPLSPGGRGDGGEGERNPPLTPIPSPAGGEGGHNAPPDWKATARRFVRQLKDDRRDQLADRLKLPRPALHLVPYLGWDSDRGGWTWAECDAAGEVIGVGVRLVDGSKRCVPGSRRGLFLPNGWRDCPGPVFIVEGMSDAVALGWVGLSSVGRPGAKAGTDLLAALLAPLPPDRPLVVLGENDRKADGTWPGKEGADFTAARLRALLPGRTVLVAAPPEGSKDAREWVTLRLGAAMADQPVDPADPTDAEAMAYALAQAEDAAAKQVGQDIAAQIARLAKQAPAPPAAGRKAAAPPLAPFPVPMPVTELARGSAAGVPWVWDGYLARGRVTLFSALPKCGKTTLLSHLLKALDCGGSFCGRSLLPGSAVVVTEESADEWVQRADALGLTERVRVLSRPFFGKPSYEDWLSFLTHLLAHLDQQPADVVVFDTLADLWPAKDENSATDVHAALQPLRKVADGRAVCVVHHLRKSDGQEGTGTRGSGALVGFVDVILELRRAAKATDPTGRRRVLKGYGRMAGIPDEWLVEMAEDGSGYSHVDPDAAAVESREKQEEGRKDELRQAILAVLPPDDPDGLTREEIWEALPDAVRKNEKRFRQVLDDATGQLWRREGTGGKGGAFRYWRNEIVTHPGEEEGGE